jgi:hypothetical protein
MPPKIITWKFTAKAIDAQHVIYLFHPTTIDKENKTYINPIYD